MRQLGGNKRSVIRDGSSHDRPGGLAFRLLPDEVALDRVAPFRIEDERTGGLVVKVIHCPR